MTTNRSEIGGAYALLGVGPGATPEEIKRAYRRLAFDLHPDRHPEASPAQRQALAGRFAAVASAYDQIKDGKAPPRFGAPAWMATVRLSDLCACGHPWVCHYLSSPHHLELIYGPGSRRGTFYDVSPETAAALNEKRVDWRGLPPDPEPKGWRAPAHMRQRKQSR